ncbi:MAG: hypothetical protein QM756_38745 [Polyangiaceae bacterium]
MMRARAYILATASALALHCSPSDDGQGGLAVVVTSDLASPKDINQLRLQVVTPDGNQKLTSFAILPDSGGKPLPLTLGVLPASAAGQDVLVRLTALRDPGDGSQPLVRVVREANVTVPNDHVGLLSLPLRWLCDGHVAQDNSGNYSSDCPAGQTCTAGECGLSKVTLAVYTPGMELGADGSSCMNVAKCFATARSVAPDAACTLPLPANVDPLRVNVAMLPASADGQCDASAERCLIPLDSDEKEGFSIRGGRIALPPAVCTGLAAGRIRSLALSTACQSKSVLKPLCGPWTKISVETDVDEAPAGGAGGASSTGGVSPMGGEAGSGGDEPLGMGGTLGAGGSQVTNRGGAASASGGAALGGSPSASGGTEAGGADDGGAFSGGAASGGAASGGAASGGAASGGAASGGAASGGAASGGTAVGGALSGGAASGGAASGGAASGGAAAGGALSGGASSGGGDSGPSACQFVDANLEAWVRSATRTPSGPISAAAADALTSLVDASGAYGNIASLEGIQCFKNLSVLRSYSTSLGILDLDPLTTLTELTELDLYYSQSYISDLTPLAKHDKLTKILLQLSRNPYSPTDLTPLASLPALTTLQLNYGRLSDLSPLSSITSLTTLELFQDNISDLSPLSKLTNLTFLSVAANPGVSDIEALASLGSLSGVSLAGTGVWDFSPLLQLSNLTSLSLGSNYVLSEPLDLSQISSLIGLTSLSVFPPFTDLPAIGRMSAMRDLQLMGSPLSDLTTVSSFKNLYSLTVSGASLTDISTLGTLANLGRLDLSNNPLLSDLSSLRGFSSLSALVCSNTGVTALSPLSALPQLRSLDSSSSPVTDIAPLVANASFANGATLNLQGTPLGCADQAQNLSTLTARGVIITLTCP